MSAMDNKKSLELESLNLEDIKSKRTKWTNKSRQNIFPSEELKDSDENRQTAVRRATLLKQKILSTELKVKGLKKNPPDPIHGMPASELLYETQLDELTLKLDSYTEDFDKEKGKSLSLIQFLGNPSDVSESVFKRRSVAIGEKFAKFLDQDEQEMEDSKSKKNAFRAFGNFLDIKLRGHKRTKSDDLRIPLGDPHLRPRSSTNIGMEQCRNRVKEKFMSERRSFPCQIRTEIDAKALAEIEAFEKFIEDYLKRHNDEYSL